MSKKKLTYFIFFAVLIGVFYAIVQQWIVRKDTISVVQPFSFTNQDGVIFTDKDVEGKVYVAEFFFTTCPGICPIMNNNMKIVYNEFKDADNFLILSYTCDPERDSVQRLKHYSDSLGVDTQKWIFLTGRKDSLYTTARLSYTIDDPANNLRNLQDDFLHTQFWALVNQKGEVKKIYDGLKQSEIKALIRDTKKLLSP